MLRKNKVSLGILRAVYQLKILPRWVIIVIDLLIIVFSTALGYLLRFNFSVSAIQEHEPWIGGALNVLFAFLAIVITGSYKGIVRYTGIQDSVRIFYMLLIMLGLLSAVNVLWSVAGNNYLVPFSVVLITFLGSFLFLFNYRLLVKYTFSFYNRGAIRSSTILIYGAGQTGIITKNVIDSNRASRVVGFLENDSNKIGKVLNGSKIYSGSSESLESLILGLEVDELIITVKNLNIDIKTQLVDTCLKYHVKIRIVPPIEKWVKGELSLNQIKDINIEDLLERDSIKLQNDNVERQLKGKKVCITGAAGSIGSEIVRQIASYSPASIILVDQSESALFEVDREITPAKASIRISSYVADITNQERIRSILLDHRPDLIFHAAAYKHVPLMESNPSEAVACNILGTKVLADLSVELNIEKFVMISTDKAVNPTNVMGCSKRIAEVYVQALNDYVRNLPNAKTSFITTRFGNVLGSNGSVIPVFKKQIAQGGPITVTHPDITRYFMTIGEACQLVLEAGAMGRGGEIFIFDMGEMVRIHDLAKRMISLSGLEPGKDIDIVFTGLRDGEKLFEELLNDQENTIPTHHEKIMIANVQKYSYQKVNSLIGLFNDLVNDKNELKMVALMKEIVPEFKSNYSRFEILDHESVNSI